MDIAATEAEVKNQPIPIKVPKPKGGFRPGSGRPRKAEPKAPTGEPFILPKIPFRRGVNRFEDFVTWWHALSSEQIEKLIVYVYRQWPVCDAKIADPDATDNIEKITGPCPFTIENWRMDILTRYQSGSYCFYVKEGNVQRWTIYAQDIVDLVNYPPLIDYKTLMLSAPANKDFVRWARQRNLIPNAESEESTGMANAAVDRLVDQSDRLVNRVIELSDRAGTPPDVDTSAQLAGMEMIQRAGERALDVAMKSADRLAEMSQKSNDPLELVKAFTDMSAQIHGNGKSDDDKVTRLMEAMLEDSRKRADRLEEEMREMRRERRNPDGEDGEGARPRGLLGRLQEHLENKMIESLDGKPTGEGSTVEQSGSGSGKGDSFKTMLLEQAFKQLPQMIGPGGITGLLANGVALIQAARGQAPAATAAPLAGATPAQSQQPQLQKPALPGNGFPQPNPTGNAIMDDLIATTWQMAPTLLFHLHSEDRNGYTFARWLIDSNPNGRQNYNYMKEAGAEDLLKMIELYPPLDEQLKKTPEKRNAFLAEMLRLDEWEKEQAEGDDEGEEEAPVAAATAGKG